MQIKIKNKIIAKDAKLCKSFLSQIKGLMFSRQKDIIFEFEKHRKSKAFPGFGNFLKFPKEKKEIIHMFFVFYPIDIILLNKNKKVVELKQNLIPFSIYHPKNKAKYIIELKKGTIKDNKIKLKDKLSF